MSISFSSDLARSFQFISGLTSCKRVTRGWSSLRGLSLSSQGVISHSSPAKASALRVMHAYAHTEAVYILASSDREVSSRSHILSACQPGIETMALKSCPLIFPRLITPMQSAAPRRSSNQSMPIPLRRSCWGTNLKYQAPSYTSHLLIQDALRRDGHGPFRTELR